MTDEEFIKQYGKAYVEQIEKEINGSVRMRNPKRIAVLQNALGLLYGVFQGDPYGPTIKPVMYDPEQLTITVEIRASCVELCPKQISVFSQAVRLADNIEIVASANGGIVISLDFNDCFVKIGKI